MTDDTLTAASPATRARLIDLPGRGGAMATLEWGPQDRPVDLVWSHANGFNAQTYRTLLASLAAERRILAIDLRGHGRSRLPTPIEGRRDWYDLRDDLLALLGTLDAPPLVLAGHSMGATSSLLAAAEAPARVRALALFEPVILPPEAIAANLAGGAVESPLVQGALRRRAVFADKAAALDAYRGRGAFKTWSEAMLADYVDAGFRPAADGQVELACAPAWEASNFTSHAHDSWDAFARSRAPITVLRAEHESTCRVDPTTADGRVTARTVPDTTHFLPMERPDEVALTLRRLLAA